MKNRGFTLLEVMVAVAILGLSLTVILSAQAGLYSGGSYAQHTSVAIGLARCRMTEVEEELLKLGYPESETKDDGTCCEGDTHQEMRCTWKVEKIELPQAKPPDLSPASSAGSMNLGSSGFGASGSSPSPAGGGPLAAMTQLMTNPGALAGDAGAAGMASAIQQGMGGPGGIESMAMSFVYPMLKPMLEASIRKVTVSVNWKEGIQDRDITIVQYVTRPMKAPPPPPGASSAGSPLIPGLPPGLFGGGLTGGGAPTTTTGGAIR